MKIVVLCATHRGYLFLKKLHEIAPDAELIVFCFRETAWEPPFLEKIQQLTDKIRGTFYEARSVSHQKWETFWNDTDIDLMFMVSWRYIVPKQIYERPRLGTYVFHDSLLPKYRGFAPTVWAIINGETQTGVTLFQIEEEIDSGDIVAQQVVPIEQGETINDVIENVTLAYLNLLEENFASLANGTPELKRQDHSKATFTCKWLPEDSEIDWSQSSETIYNLIRATTRPYPGAFTFLDGKKLIIWSATVPDNPQQYVTQIPGRIVAFRENEGATILTGDSVLLLQVVQLEGEEDCPAESLLNRPSITLGR